MRLSLSDACTSARSNELALVNRGRFHFHLIIIECELARGIRNIRRSLIDAAPPLSRAGAAALAADWCWCGRYRSSPAKKLAPRRCRAPCAVGPGRRAFNLTTATGRLPWRRVIMPQPPIRCIGIEQFSNFSESPRALLPSDSQTRYPLSSASPSNRNLGCFAARLARANNYLGSAVTADFSAPAPPPSSGASCFFSADK